jgi:transketolase
MKSSEIAMRDVYGQELIRLGDKNKELVVLDADVSTSTRTNFFGEKYPERFFNVGVSEANMVDMAGGLALSGLKPIVNTFSVFLTLKATEQIRNVICYNKLPVILVGNYAGLSDSFDGASHQSIADIAIMRSMPNLNVVVPADAMEMKQALRHAVSLNEPTFLRICRNPTPIVFQEAESYVFGRIKLVKEGDDITLAACGITVPIAIQASSELESMGISTEILNISTIKPLDKETLINSVKKTKRIITIEEHTIIGGLGGAVAEVLIKHFPVPMDFIGIGDTFTETGSYTQLLEKYEISKETIIEKVKNLV